jgi:hypothetical protein
MNNITNSNLLEMAAYLKMLTDNNPDVYAFVVDFLNDKIAKLKGKKKFGKDSNADLHRYAILLRHVEDGEDIFMDRKHLSYSEIAEFTGCSRAAAQNLYERALRKISNKLEKEINLVRGRLKSA